VGHRAGGNNAKKMQFLATAGNRNTISNMPGHYNDYIGTAASNDTNQCGSNNIDNYYYYGDNDGYYSNDNDNDNDISLTEATN
jgi:hypothetical protein